MGGGSGCVCGVVMVVVVVVVGARNNCKLTVHAKKERKRFDPKPVSDEHLFFFITLIII